MQVISFISQRFGAFSTTQRIDFLGDRVGLSTCEECVFCCIISYEKSIAMLFLCYSARTVGYSSKLSFKRYIVTYRLSVGLNVGSKSYSYF